MRIKKLDFSINLFDLAKILELDLDKLLIILFLLLTLLFLAIFTDNNKLFYNFIIFILNIKINYFAILLKS